MNTLDDIRARYADRHQDDIEAGHIRALLAVIDSQQAVIDAAEAVDEDAFTYAPDEEIGPYLMLQRNEVSAALWKLHDALAALKDARS